MSNRAGNPRRGTADQVDAKVRATLERMTDAFFSVDPEWRFTYVNGRAEALLQRARAELFGRNLWEAFPDAVGTAFYDEYNRARTDGCAVEFVEFYSPLETWFEVRAIPSSEGLDVYFRDISERVRLEAQLQQAQKMEAVGQLAGGIAHDFNNLLTAISGYAQLGLTEVSGTETPVGRYLEEIQHAGQRAAELTRQLLAFSRRQMLQPTMFDLNDAVSSSEKLLRRLLGEHIRIVTSLAPDGCPVTADRSQVEQVLVNLAVNARDAMPNGGALTLDTENVEVREGDSDERFEAPGDYVVLRVTDTGSGMDATTREHAFEPFFTTKEPGKGTGLGLAMVYGIVTQSGGWIAVHSEPGLGTTFEITLPRSMDTAEPAARPHRPLELRNGTERVLLVEDEPVVRELTAELLARQGYEVTAVGDPEEALALAERERVDIVFTDVVMPKMSGRRLVARLRESKPELPVVYTSGYSDDTAFHEGDLEENVTFLRKPYSTHDLARAVREALDRTR
jgi:PAS domain S-box-containing protein